MFRIAALNDCLSGSEGENDDAGTRANVGPSREVLESSAHANHTTAIMQLAKGQDQKAEENFLAVLNNPYVANAQVAPEMTPGKPQNLPPEITLRYSCYKNLAGINMNRKSYQEACEYYLKAMELDSTEVGVCYRMGLAAIQLQNFELALVAFQEGLNTSPNHLICLDQLLSVLVILGMHLEVLGVSITVLRRHPQHAKARALTRFVLDRWPLYGETARHLYPNSEVLFNTSPPFDEAAGERSLATCLALRPGIRCQEPQQPIPVTQTLACPLTQLSWPSLAAALLHTLEHMDAQDPALCLTPLSIKDSLIEYDKKQEAIGQQQHQNKKIKNNEEEQQKVKKDTGSSSQPSPVSEAEGAADKRPSEGIIRRRRTTIEAGASQDTFRVDHHHDRVNPDHAEIRRAGKGGLIESTDQPTGQKGDQSSEAKTASPATETVQRSPVVNSNVSPERPVLLSKNFTVDVKGVLFCCKAGDEEAAPVDSQSNDGDVQTSNRKTKKFHEVTSEKCKLNKIEERLFDGKRIEINLSTEKKNNMCVFKPTSISNKMDIEPSGRIIIDESVNENKEGIKRHLEGDSNSPIVKKAKFDSCTIEADHTSLEEDDACLAAVKASIQRDVGHDYNPAEEQNKGKMLMRRRTESSELTEDEDIEDEEEPEESEETNAEDDEEELDDEEEDIDGETSQDEATQDETTVAGDGDALPDEEEEELVTPREIEEEEEEEELVTPGVIEEGEDIAIQGAMDLELLNQQIHEACAGVQQTVEDEEEDGNGERYEVHEEDINDEEHALENFDGSSQEGGDLADLVPSDDSSDLAATAESNDQLVEENHSAIHQKKDDLEQTELSEDLGDVERLQPEDLILAAQQPDLSVSDRHCNVEEMEFEFNAAVSSEAVSRPASSLRLSDAATNTRDSKAYAVEGALNDFQANLLTVKIKDNDGGNRQIETELPYKEVDSSSEDEKAPLIDETVKKGTTMDVNNSCPDNESVTLGENNRNDIEAYTCTEKEDTEKEDEEYKTDTCDEKTESATDLDDDFASSVPLRPVTATPRGRGRGRRRRHNTRGNHVSSHHFSASPLRGLDGGVPLVNSPRTSGRVRRGKRGLERELQQLDYWGRREDGAATARGGGANKRRRRTGHDGITAAHLLRSFVPAALLRTNGDSSDKLLLDNLSFAAAGTSKLIERNAATSAPANPLASVVPASGSTQAPPTVAQNIVAGPPTVPLNDCAANALPPNKSEASEQAGEKSESQFVREFVLRHSTNHGLLYLLGHLLEAMVQAHHNTSVWTSANTSALVALYPSYRESIQLCPTLDPSPSLYPSMRQHCLAALAYWELSVSLALAKKSPLPVRFLEEDVLQLSLLLGRGDVIWDQLHYKQRFSWLRAQTHLLQDQHNKAVPHLYQVVEECEDLLLVEVPVWRTEADTRRVTLIRANGLLKSLLRRQLVKQVEEEFGQQRYGVVVDVVCGELAEDSGCEFADADQRTAHCTMLLHALTATRDYTGLFEWGSVILEYEMKQIKAVLDNQENNEDEERDDQLVQLVLQSLETAVTEESAVVSAVSGQVLVRLVEGLIAVLAVQLEHQSTSCCVGPWLLLHRVLLQQELEAGAPRPRPSTLLLVTAHDELAKLDRCCREEGRLLLYTLPILLEELSHDLPVTTSLSLTQARDQTTHCLYHLPTRRNKRGVRDHGSGGVLLTHQQALALYPHYCPPTLPQFQAANPPSITEDTAALFKRFLELLPTESSIDERVKEVEDFLNGIADTLSYIEPPYKPHPLPDIFYLMADYYFKNKEWEVAVQYYKQDLAVCPSRLDSWAGLSLSQKTQLETLLNSCEVIQDEEKFLKQVEAASACFSQALRQDDSHSNLWVEYGGLVYMAFSHASRLLKQDLNPDISIDMYQLLENTKTKMLVKAEQCFSRALELSLAEDEPDEERWLYYYMLGKIGEKKADTPRVVIGRYVKAAEELHLNAAQYPTKINYNNPQEYAVEALEMFFRIHSYIVKYIEQKDAKFLTDDVLNYFLTITEEVNKCNFYTMTEFKERAGDSNIVVEESQRGSSETRAWMKALVLEMVDAVIEKANQFKTLDSSIEEIVPEDKMNSIHDMKNFGSDDEIMVVEETQQQKNKKTIISRCLQAFNLCLTRFPHHYKSLYRLAQYYHTTKLNRDNNKTRNYLIGCSFWQRYDYMHVNGLFNERKIWYQQPKNCNLFHGVWRIPNDEIDRPGSFAAHMYRCVSLALDVLPNVKDFLTTLDIALALKLSPEKDKKYLRENERQLLCEHATQVGLQAIKDKFRILFKTNAIIHRNRRLAFLFDVYRCYRHMSKHLAGTEATLASVLGQTYAILENVAGDAPTLLRKAEAYCASHNMAGHSCRGTQPAGRGGRLKRMSNAQHQLQQAPAMSTVDVAGIISTQQQQTASSSTAKSLATPQPRSMATPLPRSNAVPVPRSSATPVPRSTASPLPRKDVAPISSSSTAAATATSPTTSPVTHSETANIEKAYSVYENLILCQTKVNQKNADPKEVALYRTRLDGYQKELLQYLKIPAVSQYFHKSLQQMGNTASKLPAPKVQSVSPAGPLSNSNTSISYTTADSQPNNSVNLAKNAPTLSGVDKRQNMHVPMASNSHPTVTSKKAHIFPTIKPTSVSTATRKPSAKINKKPVPQQKVSADFSVLPKGLSVTISSVPKSVPSKRLTTTATSLESSYSAVLKSNALSNAVATSKKGVSVNAAAEQSKTAASPMVQLNAEQLMQLAYTPVHSTKTDALSSSRRLNFGAVGAALANNTTKTAYNAKVGNLPPPRARNTLTTTSHQNKSFNLKQRAKPSVSAQVRPVMVSNFSLPGGSGGATGQTIKPLPKDPLEKTSHLGDPLARSTDDDIITLD